MSKLLLAVDEHYIGRVTWRGQLTFNTIRVKFEELQLLKKGRACPFKQFFKAPLLRFSGIIIHQLLSGRLKVAAKMRFILKLVGNL